ncbi:NAD-dependent epimerase/dehydratase family protein [Roseibium salinum]|uniref:NAD-dependent epimerase/dehydratase family protein n=1 Tax=Roseibium salinum TaxID=1604349 RepID=UPI0035F0C9D2
MVQRILITGGGGFIGRYVASELLAHEYDVRILDSLIDQVHSDGYDAIPDGAEFIEGDVRDADTVKRALQDVDGVVHLAAEVGVGQSMYEIARYVGSNDLGTAVLLEAMIGQPVKKIVVASSMSIYGEGLYENEAGERFERVRRSTDDLKQRIWDPASAEGAALRPVPTDEEKTVDLSSIYALTKYAQEKQTLIFGSAYGVDAVALRLFNVFGAGQALSNPYTGVLANFACRLANHEPPTIFEDGRQKRDFVHVKDVARAFRSALESTQAAGQAINIGSGRSYDIATVASLLAEAMGLSRIEPAILQKYRAGDIRNCFADISKARELLGYEPRHWLEDSLEEFADWVRQNGAVDLGGEMKKQLETRGLIT